MELLKTLTASTFTWTTPGTRVRKHEGLANKCAMFGHCRYHDDWGFGRRPEEMCWFPRPPAKMIH